MDIKQLQALGAIVPRSIQKKEISIHRPVPLPADQWADPATPEFPEVIEYVDEKIDAHIRKRSSADFIEMMAAPENTRSCYLILRCVCNEDGSQLFDSIEQVSTLAEWLFMPLLVAVYNVNNADVKNSMPRVSSGATSRSRSAVGQLRSGKKSSRKKNAASG